MKRMAWQTASRMLLFVACTSLACGCEAPDKDKQPQRPGITKVDPAKNIDDIKSDEFKMGQVTIEGDVLKIQVSYGGGARDHDFTLYWNQVVLTSYPGQTSMVLKHDAHGDNAEAHFTKTLDFDLAAITKPMIITVLTDHGDKATVPYGETE